MRRANHGTRVLRAAGRKWRAFRAPSRPRNGRDCRRRLPCARGEADREELGGSVRGGAEGRGARRAPHERAGRDRDGRLSEPLL
eukprot:6348393-Prymnesium_polylepis.1